MQQSIENQLMLRNYTIYCPDCKSYVYFGYDTNNNSKATFNIEDHYVEYEDIGNLEDTWIRSVTIDNLSYTTVRMLIESNASKLVKMNSSIAFSDSIYERFLRLKATEPKVKSS